jgi:hypothetical protein
MLDRLETKYAQTQGAAPAALGDEQAGLPQVATQSRSRMRPGSMLRRRENRGIDDESSGGSLGPGRKERTETDT